jgi:hypothetical protein
MLRVHLICILRCQCAYNIIPNAAPATAKNATNPTLAGCSPPAAFLPVGGAVEVEPGAPDPDVVGDPPPLLLFAAAMDLFQLPTIQLVASVV